MPDALATAVTNTNPNSCVNVQSGRLCKPWHLSNKGLQYIAIWESGILNGTYKGRRVVDGFVLSVYDDGYHIPTVGLGHRVNPQDHLRIGDEISIERAKEFMRMSLHDVESAVNRYLRVPLFQYEYDALISVLWNTGPFHAKHDKWPETRTEHLTKSLNDGEYSTMRDVILGFFAERVRSRRASEVKLFTTGVYDASH